MSDRVEGEPIQLEPEVAAKLEAIRKAAEHSFPSGDIGELLDEVELGYQG